MKLRRLATRDAGFEAELAALTRNAVLQDPAVQESVRAILADVRVRGDEAVLDYTRKFDRIAARSLAELEVPKENLQRALEALPRAQAGALREAGERIRDFHSRQLQSSWDYTDQDGTRLGQQVTALDRVGIYVPGGKAAYPSSVLMNAIPARVAGVREIVMASPPTGGRISDMALALAGELGATKIALGHHRDDILETFVTIGTYDTIARKLSDRYGGVVTHCEFSIPVKGAADKERLRDLAKTIQAESPEKARRAIAG